MPYASFLFLIFCEILCDLPLRLSFTCCLFNVFTIERALETVFICFPSLGCCFIPHVNVSDCYILVVVPFDSERWFSSACLMILLLGTWNCSPASALSSFLYLSWVNWLSHVNVSGSLFSRQSVVWKPKQTLACSEGDCSARAHCSAQLQTISSIFFCPNT